ncbi:MAG: hypothetical protein JST48_14740 [Bacteroidetes bacterium]|nr:hypothetical protein [Bacteroidota bacterium]
MARFYDIDGNYVAYCGDFRNLYDRFGKFIGYFLNNFLYDLRGDQIGFVREKCIYNNQGAQLYFTK